MFNGRLMERPANRRVHDINMYQYHLITAIITGLKVLACVMKKDQYYWAMGEGGSAGDSCYKLIMAYYRHIHIDILREISDVRVCMISVNQRPRYVIMQ